jgi:hypothetical protein
MLMSGPPTPPTVTVSALDASAREGSSDDAVLQFTRSGDTSMSLAVNYTLGGGTAGAADYMAMPVSPMSFLPGQSTVNVTVDAMADNLVEGSETLVATLQPGMGYTVGGASTAQVTIVDDPVVVSIAATDPLATEPMGNAAQFTVSRTGGNLQQSLTVPLTYSGTAQHLGDYNASTSVLLVGGQASATITVQPMQDAAVEGPETVIATLSTPAGNPPQYTLGTSTAQATILDDDSTPSLSINDVSVAEGDAGTTQAVFTLQLSTATANVVTVQYATADGTATAGSDYQQTTGSHTFQPGETQKSVSVSVIGDTTYEPSETFYVNLSMAVSATIADAQGAGTISNDDQLPVVDLDIIRRNNLEVPEDQEHTPGWFNLVNDDDDDEDGIVDLNDSVVAGGDNDLLRIKLRAVQPTTAGGSYTLDWTSNKIRIWRNADRSGEVIGGTVFSPQVEETLYVEGVAPSDPGGKEEITLRWQAGAGSIPTVSDTVAFTIARFDLVAHQAGTMAAPGAAVPETAEDQWSSLYVPVNDDDNPAAGLRDNADQTASVPDDDLVQLAIAPLPNAPGEVELFFPVPMPKAGAPDIPVPTYTRMFDGAGNEAIPNNLGDTGLEIGLSDAPNPNNPLNGLHTGSATLHMEALLPYPEVLVSATYTEDGALVRSDDVYLQLFSVDVDVDVDSLNNNTLGGQQSDAQEDLPALPGKWINANARDLDGDGVPDYADGLHRFTPQNATPSPGQFSRLQIALPVFPMLQDGEDRDIDPTMATLTFQYPAADPNAIWGLGPHEYAPPVSGTLTIWTDAMVREAYAPEQRVSRHPQDPAAAPAGHWVAAATPYTLESLGYDPETQTVTLWVEGLNPSAGVGLDTIEAILDPAGPSGPNATTAHDTVRATVIDVDLDIDSDNTGLGQPVGPGGTLLEDGIEEMLSKPGKIILRNAGDVDGDGVRDFVDGYDVGAIAQGASNPANAGVNASGPFTPVTLRIPAPLDLGQVGVRLTFSTSDPAAAADANGDGQNDVPGKIRLWTKDGTVARDGRDVAAGGDWINAGTVYTAAQLGLAGPSRTVTLYVEGVETTPSVGMETILVEVLPTGSIAHPAVTDRVNYTVATVGMQGRIQYDPANPKPVRRALVTAEGGLLGTTELGRTYTDDDGYYFLVLPDDGTNFANLELFVWTQSRPGGDDPSLPRGTYVESDLGDDYYLDFTTSITVSPNPAGGTFIGTADYSGIAATTDAEKAFWVYDAALTAAQFHGTLPGVPEGSIEIDFPAALGYNYTYLSNPHIVDTAYDDWDTIIHEYGHAVQQEHGFFPDWTVFPPPTHNLSVNQRTEHDQRDFEYAIHLGFSEGFANFFSMAAQQQGYVPPAGTQPPGAGDGKLYTHSVEAAGPDGKGEDEELSVMRVLFDLADPVDTTTPGENDRVELGFDGLFSVLDTNDVHSVDELWDKLVEGAAGNPQRIADYGAIFEAHNVSPTALAMTVGGTPVTVVAGGGSAPDARWDIPQGSPGTGDVLNRFGVKVFDENMVEILDTGLLIAAPSGAPPGPGEYARATSPAGVSGVWTPSATDWGTISGAGTATPGTTLTRYWVVYGTYDSDDDSTISGAYWSDLRRIDVQW